MRFVYKDNIYLINNSTLITEFVMRVEESEKFYCITFENMGVFTNHEIEVGYNNECLFVKAHSPQKNKTFEYEMHLYANMDLDKKIVAAIKGPNLKIMILKRKAVSSFQMVKVHAF